MKYKLNIFIAIILLFFYIDPSCAASQKTEKFTGSYLRSFHAYQLGTNEFVLKLYGNNLPAPEPDFFENTMQLTLSDTKVKNVHAMKLLTDNIEHSVPLIAGLDIENLPDDQVSILLTANSPMKLESTRLEFDGLTIRIKVQEELQDSNLTNNIALKPAENNYLMFPHDTLYFSAEERITVEFRDAELRDIFRTLMDRLERNIIIDSTFPSASVTMSLKGIKISEVLNYLMRQYDIACYRAGTNTVAFGSKNNLYKLSGERIEKSFRIAYAELAQAVTMLKSMTGVADSEITIDERMRTLHVNTNPAKMKGIEKALAKIDVPQSQVMIRATIFEFSDAATNAVQHSLEMVYDRWTMNLDLANGTNLLRYDDQTYRNGRTNFNRYITATLSALETKDKGRTVANPSVIAIDGQEAKVSLKQNILYRKGYSKDGDVQWDEEEVGPELTFKPKIEDKGYINLEITIKTGDYLGADSDGNIRTTDREVKTKVRVKDGMPFVIGGLHQDTLTHNRNKIPILGNIPLLGELFSFSSKANNRNQAVMIVTPYIIESR